ncbi:MAG: hypothetical protein LGR52_07015 [Candidatus Thiosymbion ectosymbiont of Robbea hypermnestra]|nr:hypothetical protein [Candidatus Thiosymbion ectosymbiont of Robbea hypermnestra]
MKLPNREFAYVPGSKLKDYLLSETHMVGRTKAKFFRMFGFDETNVDILEHGLIEIARARDVKDELSSSHGKKYVVDGALMTPIGRSVEIKTIWIIDKGEDKPRFLTAYPG